jgi:hypothetical protein
MGKPASKAMVGKRRTSMIDNLALRLTYGIGHANRGYSYSGAWVQSDRVTANSCLRAALIAIRVAHFSSSRGRFRLGAARPDVIKFTPSIDAARWGDAMT